MKRIVFIQPAGEFNAYAFFRLPLMGLLCLGTILERRGFQVRILPDRYTRLDGRNGRVHPALAEADLVGISAMTSTARRAYRLADLVRRVNPRAKVVLGGPHVTFRPEEAARHAHLVVRGEAETVLDEILQKPAGIVEGAPLEDLDRLPTPDIGLLPRRWRPPFARLAPVSTSRGCPYNCSFCAVTPMFGRRYRFRGARAVLEELEVRFRDGYRQVFFYDDHFAADRGRTVELLEGIIRRRLKVTWSAQARTEVARDGELLELMKRSGCATLFLGLESVNPATLRSYRKRQTFEQMRQAVRRIHERGIKVCGMFVLGADTDTTDTIEATLRFCLEEGLHAAQFAILIPLPGTAVHEQMQREGRIVDRDWSHYDGTHVVYRPLRFTRRNLQRRVLEAWRRFYDRRDFLFRWAARYLIWSWRRRNAGFLRALEGEPSPAPQEGG